MNLIGNSPTAGGLFDQNGEADSVVAGSSDLILIMREGVTA